MTDAAILGKESMGDGVVLLTLNRPERRNALSAQLRGDLAGTLAELADDNSCQVVVLTGAGGTFCAGFDLKELEASDAPGELFADADSYHHAVHTFPKPIIAAIAGPAVAGGLDLAAMCDIRVAQTDATFGQPQVRFGVPAAFELMRSVLAEPVARELCLTGRVVDAAEAERMGLVNRVVDHALDHALALALMIAASPAAAAVKAQIVQAQPSLFAPDDGSVSQ